MPAPSSETRPTVLILPGYGSSGPEHWQSRWEERFGYRRVEQDDWLEPQADDWVQTLEAAVQESPSPVILVAHSLGCALVARWAATTASRRVVGALLVAPADVESAAHTPDEVRSFAPLPRSQLPFPAIVVASTDDAFMALSRAETLAGLWGARFVNVGARGHINADAGVGEWIEGHQLLNELCALVQDGANG